VTAPPEFDDEAVAAHRERASKAWAAGWTKREQRRVVKALDEDRRTIGARYLTVAQLYPWLTLALERARVVGRPALYLAERLTEAPLSWSAAEQAHTNGAAPRPEGPWVPVVGDERGQYERTVLTPSSASRVAVLADLGSASQSPPRPTPPEDEYRRASSGRAPFRRPVSKRMEQPTPAQCPLLCTTERLSGRSCGASR